MAVLLDHVLRSTLFLFSDNCSIKSFTCTIPELPLLLLLLQLLQATMELACLFQYLLFL